MIGDFEVEQMQLRNYCFNVLCTLLFDISNLIVVRLISEIIGREISYTVTAEVCLLNHKHYPHRSKA